MIKLTYSCKKQASLTSVDYETTKLVICSNRSWKFLFQIELLFTYLEQEVLEVKDQIIKYLSLKTQKRHFNQAFASMGSITDCTTLFCYI